eukprot:765782-Hanusia_phi.AAC.5
MENTTSRSAHIGMYCFSRIFQLEAPKQYKTGAREEITQRRLTVSKYRDQTYVSIREFYAKDGQMLPGKKGIYFHDAALPF